MMPSATLLALQQDLGHRIRSLRKSQGLTLAGLSRLSGVAVPALSLIENGARDVKFSSLVSLSTALRVSIADLFLPEAALTAESANLPVAPGYDLGDD